MSPGGSAGGDQGGRTCSPGLCRVRVSRLPSQVATPLLSADPEKPICPGAPEAWAPCLPVVLHELPRLCPMTRVPVVKGDGPPASCSSSPEDIQLQETQWPE